MGQATRACLLLVAAAVAAAAVLHVVCLFADCGGRQPLSQGVAAAVGAHPRLRTAGGATTRRAPRPTPPPLIPADEDDDDEVTITCRRPLVFRKDGCHLPDAASSERFLESKAIDLENLVIKTVKNRRNKSTFNLVIDERPRTNL